MLIIIIVPIDLQLAFGENAIVRLFILLHFWESHSFPYYLVLAHLMMHTYVAGPTKIDHVSTNYSKL